MEELFTTLFASLSELPWLWILLLGVATFLFSMLWYGVLFKEALLRLQNKSKESCEVNKFGMAIQLCEHLLLAYFLALLVTYTALPHLLLLLDAFLGTLLFGLLAGKLFTIEQRSSAWKLWGIHAGFYCSAICAVATIFFFTLS